MRQMEPKPESRQLYSDVEGGVVVHREKNAHLRPEAEGGGADMATCFARILFRKLLTPRAFFFKIF